MRFSASILTFFALVGLSSAASCPAGLPTWCSRTGCRDSGECNPHDACMDAGTTYFDKCNGASAYVCDPDHQCK
ncbi:hypothetical protein EV122DRAFT_279287 [Schizophyllum commune]